MRRVVDTARRLLEHAENGAAVVSLLLAALIPVIESFTRLVFRSGMYSSAEYLQHLAIWVTFTGGMITARDGRHLALSAGVDLLKAPGKRLLATLTATVAATVAAFLALSSWQFITMAFDSSATVGVLPLRPVVLIIPVGFAVMSIRFIARAPAPWYVRLLAALVPIATLIAAQVHAALPTISRWPLVALLTGAGLLGAPIFTVLGGIAAVLFLTGGGVTAILANEVYTMLTGPIIITIPLFAFTGFVLSESRAGDRLVGFFRSAAGWLPGGLAVMAVVVCAFFTTFTGASGVTILALGGLLSYVLVENRYEKSLSTGLLTASGSVGLLLPPSLPIILYGVIANTNIKHLFIAGLLPGLLMMSTVALIGVRHARRSRVPTIPFDRGRFLAALRTAAWELALPVGVLLLYLNGITTLVETSAMAAVYALFVALVVHRDIGVRSIPAIMIKCLSTVGGILVILGVARALSYYIVDAEVPSRLTEWCSAHIAGRYVFLALLNIALLVTGCLMDVFSAIVVLVPLLVPLAEAFGVHPVHLGIIFLANLQLGYLTPPVGIDLFLAAYRFEIPLVEVYRHVLPFLAALGIAVLVITYVPWLTLGLLGAFNLLH